MISETIRIADLYECLTLNFQTKDAERLQKKLLRHHSYDDNQYDDTYIELIVGCYLRTKGLDVRYGKKISGKTPDWSVYDENNVLTGLVEVTHLRPDKETDEKTFCSKDKRPLIITNWNSEKNDSRLLEKCMEKAERYKDVVEAEDVYYLIAVFIDGKLLYFDDEIEPIVEDVFNSQKFLDGILIIDEQNYSTYRFRLWSNPNKYKTNFLTFS